MPGYGVLPVSPVEIDSVLRLARSIRLAVEQKRTKNYPVMSALLPRSPQCSLRGGCGRQNAA